MRLTRALRWMTGRPRDGHGATARRVEGAPGRSGELTMAENITLGTLVVEKGTYAVSYRADGDVQVLVLTAVPGGDTSDAATADSRRVVRTRQLVARSTVFAEELEDKSLRVKLVQFAAE